MLLLVVSGCSFIGLNQKYNLIKRERRDEWQS